MIYFCEKPSPLQRSVISISLRKYLVQLDEDQTIITKTMPLLVDMPKPHVVKVVADLITTHESPDMLMVTDYHFYVLHHVLTWAIKMHQEGRKLFGVHSVDMKYMDTLFWDLDFLLDKEVFNSLSTEQKQAARFSPELFSIINGLTPGVNEFITSPVTEEEFGV